MCPTSLLFSQGNGAAEISRDRRANQVLVPGPWTPKESCLEGASGQFSALQQPSQGDGSAALEGKSKFPGTTNNRAELRDWLSAQFIPQLHGQGRIPALPRPRHPQVSRWRGTSPAPTPDPSLPRALYGPMGSERA